MHMNFYWSTDVGDFFFKGLVINGTSSFVLLAFILFFLSIMYEGLKVFEIKLDKFPKKNINIYTIVFVGSSY